jgi:hypothetical protein
MMGLILIKYAFPLLSSTPGHLPEHFIPAPIEHFESGYEIVAIDCIRQFGTSRARSLLTVAPAHPPVASEGGSTVQDPPVIENWPS